MKTNYFISIIILAFALTSCPETNAPDAELVIINNSDEDIVYFDMMNSPNDSSLTKIHFPLTPQNTESLVIKSGERYSTKDAFIKVFNRLPGKLLMVYIFSKETIEQNSWDQIVDDYLILRRYDLTLEDLESLNWTITYP